ncbi:DUF421 domain-containing protein [Paenibacillus thalictri]|uniref:DUF421 domain-containing protein n=1 Tax=Paenibacillus thalictri TaxID=2527873 RepID=A0A4Q9DXR0_9BACL|nr:DUF421 domain-containing protein [Paenibacillus thalictri]TBL80588.1 DUF421 domain-containing protein [Paenibacillus thalictri]
MNFFKGQPSLDLMDWILRAGISFIFLLLLAKMMGQRSISQLRLLDFIIALTLGNIIAHPLSDEQLGMSGAIITSVVLVALYIAATWLGLKWPPFKRFLEPLPVTLIQNGHIDFHNLSKARISMHYLFSELRKEKVDDIAKVALAIWEPGGIISVFLNTTYQPLTPADMNKQPAAFSLTQPVVIDGKIEYPLLRQLGKDTEWLINQLAAEHAKLSEVILATIDNSCNVKVVLSRRTNERIEKRLQPPNVD